MAPAKVTAETVIIVAGQSFSLGVETDVETVRQQLLGMGFADVANAEAKTGKNDAGAPTLEFIKKAGTKGLAGADLAARLARVPPRPVGPGLRDAARVISRLLGEQLTFEEAVADDLALSALRTLAAASSITTGAPLCQRLDDLPAVAGHAPRGW